MRKEFKDNHIPQDNFKIGENNLQRTYPACNYIRDAAQQNEYQVNSYRI